MNLSSITPLILTWNEEPNLLRCLEQLRWADAVVIIDSGSTDRTLEIAAEFPNVRVETRSFDTHSQQWNYGLSQVGTPWVLALDADFIVSDHLPAEMEAIPSSTASTEFASEFRYCVNGTPLKGSLYPPRTVLFRVDSCHYIQDGHTQLLVGSGTPELLETKIDHDDRKPLRRWLSSQSKYATLEAEKLDSAEMASLGLPDKIRRTLFLAPPLAFLYTLIGKRTLLDGWNGHFYALQRAYAELLLSLELLSRKLEATPIRSRSHE